MTDFHYRRNFLNKVLLRLDFDPIPELTQNEGDDLDFSRRISHIFPHVKHSPLSNVLLKLSPNDLGMQRKTSGTQVEHRKTPNGTAILFLNPDHLELQYGENDYTHFPPFLEEFKAALSAFNDSYQEANINRVGLRYINQIKMEKGAPLTWDGYINSDLITSTKAGLPEEYKLLRSMHQLHAKKDDINLLFHYGIANPEYPAPVSRREYILDIDTYKTDEIHTEEIIDSITDLNELSEIVFQDAIEDNLRMLMEPIDD